MCLLYFTSFSVLSSAPLLPLAEVALSTAIPLFHLQHTHVGLIAILAHEKGLAQHHSVNGLLLALLLLIVCITVYLHRLHSVSCVVVPLGIASVPYVHALHQYICTHCSQHKSLATTHHTSHTYTCMYVYTLHMSKAIILLHCTSITWLFLHHQCLSRLCKQDTSCCSGEQQKQAVEWWTLRGCCWVWSQWYGRSS